jgi:hypothetical protein
MIGPPGSEVRMPRSDRHERSAASSPAASPEGLIARLFAEAARACRSRGIEPPRATIEASGRGEIPLEPRLVRRALEPLVQRAYAAAADRRGPSESPPLREVVVTVVDSGDRVEIEVADSGPWLSEAVRRWLSGPVAGPCPAAADGSALATAMAAARGLGGTLFAINCPEGGVAITLQLPGSRPRLAAA